jgi:hypothetical protein
MWLGSWSLKIAFRPYRSDTATIVAAVSPLAAPFSRVPAVNCLYAAAAPCSRIVAVFRHNGGCSRGCRQFLRRKIRNSVAVPVLAAAQFGDNFLNCAKFKENCNTIFSSRFLFNDHQIIMESGRLPAPI